MSKKTLFTACELRTIVRWAKDHTHSVPFRDLMTVVDSIEISDTAKLMAKLDEAQPHVSLGALNAAFLMGFDRMDEEHPMQEIWDAALSRVSFSHPEEIDAFAKLENFMAQSGLIREAEIDG